MSDLVPAPAYAIYRDTWQGETRWQAYYLRADIQIEDFRPAKSSVPVAPPTNVRADAFLEAVRDWRERGNLNRPWIDPNDRLFDWSGQRRNL